MFFVSSALALEGRESEYNIKYTKHVHKNWKKIIALLCQQKQKYKYI